GDGVRGGCRRWQTWSWRLPNRAGFVCKGAARSGSSRFGNHTHSVRSARSPSPGGNEGGYTRRVDFDGSESVPIDRDQVGPAQQKTAGRPRGGRRLTVRVS